MKIAIDVSPLHSGHKVRGVGFYLKHLQSALVEYFPDNDYTFFTNSEEIPHGVDIIHYPYFDPFFLTLPWKKKVRTVVTVHDLTPLVFPDAFPAGVKGNLRWQMQKFALSRTDGIVADSEASKKDIHRFTGISNKKIHVAYLAAGEEFKRVSDADVYSISKKYNLPKKFLLYVGDVTWNKNLPRLFEAVNSLGIPLVMIGKALTEQDFDTSNPWNHDRITLSKLVTDNSLIMRLGFIPSEDLVAIYNAATVFVFPSLYEGFGLPVLEAMRCGTPVVTTKAGSLAEVAGDAALFVDPGSSDAIARGIEQVFTDRSLQDELSKKGYKQEEKFSWKKTASETLRVYAKAIGS